MITIRDATIEDIPFMKAMIWEAIMASPGFVAEMGLEKIRQHEDNNWQEWAIQPNPAFIALDETGRKLGTLTLKPHEKEDEAVVGWRFGIGVEAAARGQGVGQRLIERALDYSRSHNARYLTLFVDPANTPAHTLYRKLGFVERGEEHGTLEMRISF